MNKIFPLIHPNTSCDYHRVALPFMFIPDEFKTTDIHEADVVVFNRIPVNGMKGIESIKGKKKIVVDLDDYWELPKWHPLHSNFNAGHANDIKRSIQIADVVTTTTDVLAEQISTLNKNVHVIPNALPYGHDQFTTSKVDNRNEVIYTGEHSHKIDVDLLKEIKGISTMAIPGFDLGGRKIQRQPVTSYMSVYDQANIAVVPIADKDCLYNRCKSNLKLLEAAAKKIPVIASNAPTYNAFGAPILFDNWKTSIKILQDEEINRELGLALFDWANNNYNLFYWNIKRLELYLK